MQYKSVAKYHSMLRAYERLRRINTNNGAAISNTDSQDAAEDFFSQCYHLKDWLKKDSNIVLSVDVENYVSESRTLSLAADYCNSFKHAGLDRRSRSGMKLEGINTHMKIDLTPKGFVASSRQTLTVNSEIYDVFELATKCVEEWQRYLELNGLDFRLK